MSSFWRRLLCCGSQHDEDEAAELVIVSCHPEWIAVLLREAYRCPQGQPFDFQKKVVVVEDGVLKVIPGPV